MCPKTRITSYIFLVWGGLVSLPIHAQSLRNESWVAMGSTAQAIQGQGVVVQQSIGQSSVTGVFSNASTRLSQGFLRGGISFSKEIKRPFGVIAFSENSNVAQTFNLLFLCL